MEIGSNGRRWGAGNGAGTRESRPETKESEGRSSKRVRLQPHVVDETSVPGDGAAETHAAWPAELGPAERLLEVLSAGHFTPQVDATHLHSLVPDRGETGAPPLIPEGGARVISIDHWGAPEPQFVQVRRSDESAYECALSAEMQEGLVVVSRTYPGIAGIVSTGFASCKALIFMGDRFVALAHEPLDADEALTEALDLYLRAFGACTGETEVQVTVGYTIRGLRDDCMEQRQHGVCLEEFMQLRDDHSAIHEALIALPGGATEDDRWDCVADAVARSAESEIQAWSEDNDTEIIELPNFALLVPLQGEVDLFGAEPGIKAAPVTRKP